MKAIELRNKTVDELKTEMLSLLKELFNLKFQKGTGQLPKPNLVKQVKLNIARIKTILTEKGTKV